MEGADAGGGHGGRESEHTLGGQAKLVQTWAVGEEEREVGDGLGCKDDVEDADVVKQADGADTFGDVSEEQSLGGEIP